MRSPRSPSSRVSPSGPGLSRHEHPVHHDAQRRRAERSQPRRQDSRCRHDLRRDRQGPGGAGREQGRPRHPRHPSRYSTPPAPTDSPLGRRQRWTARASSCLDVAMAQKNAAATRIFVDTTPEAMTTAKALNKKFGFKAEIIVQPSNVTGRLADRRLRPGDGRLRTGRARRRQGDDPYGQRLPLHLTQALRRQRVLSILGPDVIPFIDGPPHATCGENRGDPVVAPLLAADHVVRQAAPASDSRSYHCARHGRTSQHDADRDRSQEWHAEETPLLCVPDGEDILIAGSNFGGADGADLGQERRGRNEVR